MSYLRIDTNEVACATHALSNAKADLMGARLHALAGLALDPSVLMRGNIRARIIDAAGRLDRASRRVGRIESFAYQSCYSYDEVEARIVRQLRDPELKARVRWQDMQKGLPWGSLPLISLGVAAVGTVVASLANEDNVGRILRLVDLGRNTVETGAGVLEKLYEQAAKAAGPEEAGLMSLDDGLAKSAANVGKWAEWGSYGVQVLAAGWEGWKEFAGSRDEGDSMARSVSNGVVVGAVTLGTSIATSAAVGAAIGTVFPGPGNVVGAVVGAGVGLVAGVLTSSVTQAAINSPELGGGRSIKDRIGDGVETAAGGISDVVNGKVGSGVSRVSDAVDMFNNMPRDIVGGTLSAATGGWL